MRHTQQRNILFFGAIVLFISVSPSAVAENVSLNEQTCFGRVEIYYKNTWGTVCDDSWDMKDSDVLCKQLNCGRALETPGSARFGRGSGRVWNHSYTCSGDENSLQMCKNESSDPSCDHTRDAGVLCSGALQQPSIYLTYPDGGPIISGQAEITEGHRFVFTCSINSSYTSGVFILKFFGSNLTKFENHSSNSASFDFPAADYNHQGYYSCVYEIRLGQTHSSNETEQIHVVIKISLLKVLIYSVPAGVALLLLMTLLVVCLVQRRRKFKQLDIIQNQLYIQHCSEKDHDDEEEEEADYVNVIPGETEGQTDPAEEVKESDEDDHDYERMEDEDDHIKQMECYVVEDEEDKHSDKEESSGDENNYVNVANLLPEPDVDIYGEEDIYQNF